MFQNGVSLVFRTFVKKVNNPSGTSCCVPHAIQPEIPGENVRIEEAVAAVAVGGSVARSVGWFDRLVRHRAARARARARARACRR